MSQEMSASVSAMMAAFEPPFHSTPPPASAVNATADQQHRLTHRRAKPGGNTRATSTTLKKPRYAQKNGRHSSDRRSSYSNSSATSSTSSGSISSTTTTNFNKPILLPDVYDHLTNKLLALTDALTHTPEERAVYHLQLSRITSVVCTMYSHLGVRVVPHGSFESGVGLPDGDLDLVVVFPIYPPSDDIGMESSPIQVLESISAALIRLSIAHVHSLQIIKSANCPLLKFLTVEGNIPVDLSVSMPNSVQNGSATGPAVLPYVADWLRSLPALRPLTMFLKLFLRLRGLGSVYTGGLGGYALLAYVRSFLKRNPCYQSESELGAALLTLLTEISNAGLWTQLGIASDGSLIEKARLLEFVLHNTRDECKPHPWLVIVDPGNSENNLTAGSFVAPKVCEALKEGLLSLLLHAKVNFQPPSSDQSLRFPTIASSSSSHTLSLGMLSSVVHFPGEMMAHRAMLKEVWAGFCAVGNLQQMFTPVPVQQYPLQIQVPTMLTYTPEYPWVAFTPPVPPETPVPPEPTSSKRRLPRFLREKQQPRHNVEGENVDPSTSGSLTKKKSHLGKLGGGAAKRVLSESSNFIEGK